MYNTKTSSKMKTAYIQQRDCMLSADGKNFSIRAISATIYDMAHRFAHTKGHSMDEYDIENLAQDVWTKVWSNFFTKYDSTKAPVEAWLWKIVWREGCDNLRDIIQNDLLHTGGMDECLEVASYDNIEETVNSHFQATAWSRHIAAMDETKRKCMQMYADGYKSGEIAEILGIPADKVYRDICREKKKLGKNPWLR